MSSDRPLVDSFIAHLDESARAQAVRTSALGMVIEDLLTRAHEAWPNLDLPDDEFLAYIAQRLPGNSELVSELRVVRIEDLYLASCCARGVAGALAAFEQRNLAVVGAALGRMNIAESMRDEVRQLVRHKLFVSEPENAARISDYAGRGDLRNWVRATAVRTCLNLLRKYKREVALGDERMLAAFSAAEDDPELAHMKKLYSDEFKQVFGEALSSLEDRPKNLLYHYHVDDLTIDQIGAMYRVHRVTAYRWLNKAREQLVAQTHAKLQERLDVTPNEMDSILRLIRSELDMSIARYLKN